MKGKNDLIVNSHRLGSLAETKHCYEYFNIDNTVISL